MPEQSLLDSRPFEPGTTGWTAADLDDPRIESAWFSGRFEIIEGVLTTMPPAYYAGSTPLSELVFLLKSYLRSQGESDHFATDLDVILNEARVIVADVAWLTDDDLRKQADAVRRLSRPDPSRTRILVPPTLIIESVSPGHELHDRRTKRSWYAEFGVPNYWILDGFAQTLQCLTLGSSGYAVEVEGKGQDEIRTRLYPNLAIPLGALWTRYPPGHSVSGRLT